MPTSSIKNTMSKLYGPKFIWTVQRACYRVKRSKARAFITHGPVVEAIIKAAEREKTDLMAFAGHGRNGLYRVFYGSVAAGILHRIDRPLLLIRSD